MTPIPDNDNGNDWSLLAEISKHRSLTSLSLSKFNSPVKGFRLGIDVQPWYYHADSSQEGENPQLRLLFFRCKRLLRYPILPLFMFDLDPRRHTDNHPRTEELTEGFIPIIEAFGFEWRYAPGDPLAELACLNREGIIDAVLTDDVAVWVFGAQTVWRNPSSSHPKAKQTVKETIYKVYDGITKEHRAAMLMVLLCRHGRWCNAGSALRLARTDLAVEIYHAATTQSDNELQELLPGWRSRYSKDFRLANCVPPKAFPPVLSTYMHPSVSTRPVETYPPSMWTIKEASLPELARTCEDLFEWGWEDRILVRFRSTIWENLPVRILRRQLLCPSLPDAEIFRLFGGGDEPGKVIDKIVGSRTHHSTDKTLEYRVEVDTQLLILWTKAGLKGTRQAPEVGKGKEVTSNGDDDDGPDNGAEPAPDVDAESSGEEDTSVPKKGSGKQKPLRIWIPAIMVQKANVELAKEYAKECEEKKARKPKRKRREDQDPASKKTKRSTATPRKQAKAAKGPPPSEAGPSNSHSSADVPSTSTLGS
ncbi:hypothetical protein EV421DRAFT_775859 [Armillaria borealis]|uniref:XPG-I domain-containing protein n=1 Tax=Armillaria borealis TaxID=47425 RepID=A0AA39IEF0_9AGAR|nr:hypothetical protein EV421DRAFT_775859 [Armillaria borealis]